MKEQGAKEGPGGHAQLDVLATQKPEQVNDTDQCCKQEQDPPEVAFQEAGERFPDRLFNLHENLPRGAFIESENCWPS